VLLIAFRCSFGLVADLVEIRWRISEFHDATGSCSEVNDLIVRLFVETLPVTDLRMVI
jgi:hypothetical protein